MSGNPARSSAAHLRAWGRDWDGSPMAEDAEPMPGLTVGHLYDAAARIEELEATIERLTGAIHRVRLYVHDCIVTGSDRTALANLYSARDEIDAAFGVPHV